MWRDVIAIDDIDLSYYGSDDSKSTLHVTDVVTGILALAGGPFVEEGVDVDIWRYRYYGERPYVSNLCALPAEVFE